MRRGFLKTSKKALSVALAATVAMSAIVVSQPAKAATTDIESDLIAHYSFEGDLSNEAADTSATMRKGTATYTDNGISGKAFDFSANAGTVTFDKSALGISLEAVPTTTAFTISMWVNSPVNDDDTTIPGTLLFADGCCKYFQFRSNGDNAFPAARMCMDDDYAWNEEADHWRTSQSTQKANTWQMVTVTVSSTGKATVYVDGTEAASYWSEPNYTDDGWFAYDKGDGTYEHLFSDDNNGGTWTDSITLGTGDWWSENYAGLMDELYIYERELSADDVAALYANEIAVVADIATVGAQANVAGDKLAFITKVGIDAFANVTEAGVLLTKGEVDSLTMEDVDNENVFNCPTSYVTTSADAGADSDNYAFRTIINNPVDADVYTAVPYMVVDGEIVYGDACSMSLADVQ